MSDNLSISLDEVRAAMSRLLDQAEVQLGREIDLDADHYWMVGNGDRFDLSAAPELMASQLSDDVASIRSYLDGGDKPAVWHDLGHLIGILQRIASLTLPTS